MDKSVYRSKKTITVIGMQSSKERELEGKERKAMQSNAVQWNRLEWVG
jgi:hypothetical protein